MNINKITQTVLTASLITSMAYLTLPNTAIAHKTLAQACQLGETCPIPGNDGGQTIYKVNTGNGMHYLCEIKSDQESLKVAVSGGKDFAITKGDGMYNANPLTTIAIDGRFEQPDNPNDEGEIKINKLPFSSDGTVKCYAKS